jgi:MFS family permease
VTHFWGVALSAGVTRRNMAAYYAACFVGLAAFTFIAAAQSALLGLLGVPEDERGAVSGHIGVAAELVLIATVGIYGSMSDRIGRRPVFVFGFVVVAIGLLLAPFAGSTLALGAFRVVFAIGAAAVAAMVSTVLSDFARNQDRGKAAGLLGVMNGLGAVLTVFVLVRLPSVFDDAGLSEVAATRAAYAVVAGLCLVMALWLRAALPPVALGQRETTPPMRRLLREGVLAGRDPGIALAYAAAFTSRGNLAIVGTFFTLWLQQYGEQVRGLSTTEALAKAGIVIGVAQTVALCSAPVIGWLTDRLTRVDALLLCCAISAVGYSSTLLVDDPLGAGMYGAAVLIGIGEVGGVIASTVLIGQQAPPAVRGSVVGAFSAFGAIGILTALEIGGLLFDAWRPAAPFALFGAFSAAVVVFGLVVRNRVVIPEQVDSPVDEAVAPQVV